MRHIEYIMTIKNKENDHGKLSILEEMEILRFASSQSLLTM